MKDETITLPSRITWQQFGCNSLAYFNKFIRGKKLKVLLVYGRYTLIETPDNQQFSIHEDDIISDKQITNLKVAEAGQFEDRKHKRAASEEVKLYNWN